MKKLENFILEHSNIEILCCYAEENSLQLSDEMKKALSSFRDRLTKVLGKEENENRILDMTIEEFIDTYQTKGVNNNILYRGSADRIKLILLREGFKSLREVLKVPRSKLNEIRCFGPQSRSFKYFMEILSNAGLNPFLIV